MIEGFGNGIFGYFGNNGRLEETIVTVNSQEGNGMYSAGQCTRFDQTPPMQLLKAGSRFEMRRARMARKSTAEAGGMRLNWLGEDQVTGVEYNFQLFKREEQKREKEASLSSLLILT